MIKSVSKARLSIAVDPELFTKIERVVNKDEISYNAAIGKLCTLGYEAWVTGVVEDELGEDVLSKDKVPEIWDSVGPSGLPVPSVVVKPPGYGEKGPTVPEWASELGENKPKRPVVKGETNDIDSYDPTAL